MVEIPRAEFLHSLYCLRFLTLFSLLRVLKVLAHLQNCIVWIKELTIIELLVWVVQYF